MDTISNVRLNRLLTSLEKAEQDYENEYLDYFNNYLTIEKYAEHNNITVKRAEQIIRIGRIINRTQNQRG